MATYLTTGQLAKELGLSTSTITAYAKAGTLTPALVTPGGHYRWDAGDVRDQLATLARKNREQR